MASPSIMFYEHSGASGTLGVCNFSTPEQDDWTKLSDLSSRRRAQNRIAQRNHRAMLRNRQKASSKETSPPALPSKKSSERSRPVRSRSVASSNGSVELPCFIHYQPLQESLLEKPYQPDSLPTPRNSPEYTQNNYSFEISLPNDINALTSPPESFFVPPKVTTPSEITLGGDYLSAIESIEIPYLYWEPRSEIETARPYQTCLSPDTSRIYSLQMNTPPKSTSNIRKRTYQGFPGEKTVVMEGQSQVIPERPSRTYNNIYSSRVCGRTALHLAVEQANLAIIELLLQVGLDIDTRDEEGQSVLHVAVLEGHEASVKLLIDKGANRDLQDYDGRTALHLAAEAGSVDIITLLLDYQVAINLKDLSGRTALHRAIEEGREESVRLLLQRGADATAVVDNRTLVNGYRREYVSRS